MSREDSTRCLLTSRPMATVEFVRVVQRWHRLEERQKHKQWMERTSTGEARMNGYRVAESGAGDVPMERGSGEQMADRHAVALGEDEWQWQREQNVGYQEDRTQHMKNNLTSWGSRFFKEVLDWKKSPEDRDGSYLREKQRDGSPKLIVNKHYWRNSWMRMKRGCWWTFQIEILSLRHKYWRKCWEFEIKAWRSWCGWNIQQLQLTSNELVRSKRVSLRTVGDHSALWSWRRVGKELGWALKCRPSCWSNMRNNWMQRLFANHSKTVINCMPSKRLHQLQISCWLPDVKRLHNVDLAHKKSIRDLVPVNTRRRIKATFKELHLLLSCSLQCHFLKL